MLLKRHAKIRDRSAAVQTEIGRQVQELFDELAELLAVHEAGRETVLRPVSRTSHAEYGRGEEFPDVQAAHTDEEVLEPGDELLAVVTWAR